MPKDNSKQAGLTNIQEDRGQIEILRAIPYEDTMIYIQKINARRGTIFQWLFPHEGEIYMSYVVVKGRITDEVRDAASGLVLSGAEASIDMLMGKEPDEEAKQILEEIEGAGKAKGVH